MKHFLIIINLCVLISSCKKWEDEFNPDLVPAQVFSSTSIAPGGSIQEVILINNSGTGATKSQIIFTLTNFATASDLTVVSNTNATVTIGTETYNLTNADWDIVFSANEITFSSKPGVIIGPGFNIAVGLTISRSPSSGGPAGPVTQTVNVQPGTGGGESPTTNNIVTSTITKTAVPDLTPLQFFSNTQIAAGATIEQVIQIKNIGSAPTTAPISFFVTNQQASSGLTVTLNNSASVTIGSVTYALTNVADWNITVNPAVINFTSKPGVIIAAGGSKNVGLTISRAAAPNGGSAGSVSSTVIIANGTGGGEAPVTNNTISSSLVKL